MMKKFLISSCLLLAGISVQADDIKASGIQKITFNGDNIVITYTNGQQDTKDMEEVTITFEGVSGIEERLAITRKAGLEGQAVYNLKGQLVGNSAAQLSKGIYIIGGKKVVIK